MPLNNLTLTSSLSATMSKPNNGFAASSVGPNTLTFSLAGVSLTNWNQSFLEIYTLFTSPPAGLTATLTSGGTLTDGQAYYYKVTGVGYGGFSVSNETSGSNEATVTPSGTSQTASLSWTQLPGAVSYNIYRGTAVGAENVLIGNSVTTTFLDAGAAGTSQSPPASMPNNYVEFDLSSFTTLAAEAATAGHVLGIIITNTGTVGASQCVLTPGVANGLQWFFGGTNPSISIPPNGSFLLCGPPSGSTGQALSGASKTLRITNAGSAATTVSIAAPTGP